LHGFRTDEIPFTPEVTHMDPDGSQENSEAIKALKARVAAALKRRIEQANP